MNQSNKEYIRLLIESGVHTLLKETPNNHHKLNEKLEDTYLDDNSKTLHEISNIKELIFKISCHETPLKKTANRIVVFDGDINSKLMIIGEAPGKEEDEKGKPFVGRAGQLLVKMLGAINLKRENIYITNVIPWRPPNNRTPTETEILEFLPYLQKQIDIIKPSYIFLLGTTAAKAILATPLSLGKLRGQWHKYNSLNLNFTADVLVSYHPAFLLRSPNYKKEAWADLQMLQERLNEN